MNTSVTELCLQSECFGGLESLEITQGWGGVGGASLDRFFSFSNSDLMF